MADAPDGIRGNHLLSDSDRVAHDTRSSRESLHEKYGKKYSRPLCACLDGPEVLCPVPDDRLDML